MSMFIAGTIIHFKDGGTSEITVLHTGTKEQCDFVCANTHAVAYSGRRPFESAQAFVMEITPRDHHAAEGNGELKGRETSDGSVPDSDSPRRLAE